MKKENSDMSDWDLVDYSEIVLDELLLPEEDRLRLDIEKYKRMGLTDRQIDKILGLR